MVQLLTLNDATKAEVAGVAIHSQPFYCVVN